MIGTLSGAPAPSPSPGDHANLGEEDGLPDRLRVVLAGRYDLLHLIGLGGMATVYLARHRSHGALFAIKVLRERFAGDPGIRTRFQREALHAACLLGHPNIVSVLEVEEVDGLHFLTMPYVRGEDLDQLLRRIGPMLPGDAIQTAFQVNAALEFAARKEVLHGDLTPGNIRLSEWGFYLVLDFGLSRALGPRSHSWLDRPAAGPLLGTPFYMAPEQIRGEAADVRTDLYSLGAILFELLTGQPPFTGSTLREITGKHLSEIPALPPALTLAHPAIAALVLKLLSKRPEERYANPGMLRAALLQCGARSEASSILPDMTGQEEVRPPRRRLGTAITDASDDEHA